MAEWHFFYGDGKPHEEVNIRDLPPPPPWREFRNFEQLTDEIQQRWQDIQKLAESADNQRGYKKGQNFRIHTEKKGRKQELTEASKEVLDAVNAAIYLRRPLLVTGNPGSGKTSLAHAIAYELKLGPVLTWPITARSTLQDSLYRYDAIARLQDKGSKPLNEYIKLGAVGTAFLPFPYPRVLLIDEIDKSDINLPNDLLHLLEDGSFEISQLVREAKTSEIKDFSVRTADANLEAKVEEGKVTCSAFPIIVMTSNGERDFPPAFKRRCLRVIMPDPKKEALETIVKAHFLENPSFKKIEPELDELIKEFLEDESQYNNRATDQLLNTIYVLMNVDEEIEKPKIKELLSKRLNEDT